MEAGYDRLPEGGQRQGLVPQDLSVVIVAERRDDRLGLVLRSLLVRAGWLDLDVVVADRGGGAVARYVEEAFIGVRTLDCPGRGVAYAGNRALETVNARYVLFIDPFLEMCEGSLSALVARLDSQPEVGLLGVRRVRSDGSEARGMRRFPYGWVSGFALVRHEALETGGWLDERFFAFAEKADLCLRLRRSGWRAVHATHAAVRAPEGRPREPRLEAHAAYARIQFAYKHFPLVAAEYRWALAFRYAVRFGLSLLMPRGGDDRRQASRAALSAILKGRPPLEERSAA